MNGKRLLKNRKKARCKHLLWISSLLEYHPEWWSLCLHSFSILFDLLKISRLLCLAIWFSFWPVWTLIFPFSGRYYEMCQYHILLNYRIYHWSLPPKSSDSWYCSRIQSPQNGRFYLVEEILSQIHEIIRIHMLSSWYVVRQKNFPLWIAAPTA